MISVSLSLMVLLFMYFTKVLKGGMMFLVLTLVLGKLMFTAPVEEYSKMLSSYYFCDLMSLSLTVLSVVLTLLMVFASFGVLYNKNFYSVYCGVILVLLLMLMFSFFSFNLLFFYFFFEVSLIPTLIIIMGWGYQPERLQAGIYFMLYTLAASLPLLIVILMIFGILGSLSVVMVDLAVSLYSEFWGVSLGVFSGFMVFAFLVKMPMFITHLWLPKAHVEAPVAGSMILAGVLLKLGGYGICRVLIVFSNLFSWLSPYVVGLSIMGMLYVGVTCCRLNDMKALVAYSSVAHMGLVLSGIFNFYLWGVSGGLLMMISHGLVSSGLFCSVNMFYERLSSRSLFMNKGLLNFLPIFCLLVFLLCAYNISAPPSINLLSEIFLMISVLGYDLAMLLVFPLGSFLGAVFTFYLFSYSQHGKGCGATLGVLDSYYIEIHSLILHILPVNFLILCPSILMVYL